MHIHEYQAKILLQKYGIKVPPFVVISNEQEADRLIRELGVDEGVVKVQVHAGGRGKAGGVRFGSNGEELVRLTQEMLGMKLVTNQTGPQGVIAEKLLVTPACTIEHEYYLAALIDRSMGLPILLVSAEGGMEIEEVAEKSPEKILKVPFGIDGKLRGYNILALLKCLGWTSELAKQGKHLLRAMARLFIENDCSLLEINPLVLSGGELIALDAKATFDDDALFRQQPLQQWYDSAQENPYEVEARKAGLAYIGLEGEIGCLVNGAGLAMATMDIIHHYGGSPANFLDVGGGATKEMVAEAFRIILSDEKVKAIFVNIFGGIMDCGVLAEGIVQATQDVHVQVPLVVRMEGTNVERGREILQASQLAIITAKTMSEGAIKVVEAIGGNTH